MTLDGAVLWTGESHPPGGSGLLALYTPRVDLSRERLIDDPFARCQLPSPTRPAETDLSLLKSFEGRSVAVSDAELPLQPAGRLLKLFVARPVVEGQRVR